MRIATRISGVVALGASVGLIAVSSSAAARSAPAAQPPATAASVSTPGRNAKLAAEVPSAIRSSGVLSVGTSADYAPEEFIGKNGQTIVGSDPDLASAIARILGLRAHVSNASFSSLIPGIVAGRFDMLMAGMEDVKQREHTVTFVDYLHTGTMFYVKAHGGPDVKSLADLCGRTVALESGTEQQLQAAAQKKKCHGNLKVDVFGNENQVNLALVSNRAQVAMADVAPTLYQVKVSHGEFRATGKAFSIVPVGIALPKNSGLIRPVLGAVSELMHSGAYTTILKKWGIEEAAVRHAKVDGAVS